MMCIIRMKFNCFVFQDTHLRSLKQFIFNRYTSTYLFMYVFIYRYVRVSNYLSFYRPIYVFIYSIYIYIYIYIYICMHVYCLKDDDDLKPESEEGPLVSCLCNRSVFRRSLRFGVSCFSCPSAPPNPWRVQAGSS